MEWILIVLIGVCIAGSQYAALQSRRAAERLGFLIGVLYAVVAHEEGASTPEIMARAQAEMDGFDLEALQARLGVRRPS